MQYNGPVYTVGGTAGVLSSNVQGIPMNYTGKNINATAGSRTANVTDLLVGDVLVTDPYGPDTGIGVDLANPTTGHLSNVAWIVTSVRQGGSGVGSQRGGAIEAVPMADCRQGISARTKANMTAGTTALILANDTDGTANLRHLVASTTVNSALTATGIKAIAGVTVDTSTTAANAIVFPGN